MKHLLSAVILVLASTACAQQQTGAPAGIAVPPLPKSSASAASVDAPPGSLVFRVRLIDGRNGQPIANGHVKLWYDEPSGPGYEFATGAQGIGLMPAPVGDPLRVLVSSVDYNDCRRPARYAPPRGYNMTEVAKSGVAAENTCGNVAVHTQPGELVFFVRPTRWYENLNRSVGN
ncbi:hypothetical protein Terro_2445 [Terriglobus roseus DSM 18391]|uniref:Carboxypeptidase regulatory-like domain-containing protein n=1 Tax=Terriglobus roseus (strain DSM 18391 / NRRL B-41598 / KBS 63) TaxID=926566 RepID=I3ZGI6_TERRK|nr:hypothetical protein [Terriglobus roseus]AFL88354.1 hypothetical protein Terro_2079 [Terriglobus roseus DSM 18391]AFL88697.1 hypothetical protein Terro_2445 [Terriglobus roseus DSM 18391]